MGSHSHSSLYQTVIAGGLSGAFTRAVTQPLDVLIIRFQLQVEPIANKKGSKYSSMLQALVAIVKEEGVVALWSGHIPAQYLSISYGILQFAVFEELTEACQKSDQKFFDSHKHGFNFCNGLMAATVATVASYPFDTVRTRLVAEQKTHKVYSGFIHACSDIVKTEGPKALFKGLIPTLGQIAPHTGILFAVYKFFTDNIFSKREYFQRKAKLHERPKTSLSANLLAGSIAGCVAKTAIYPFDLVKTRLQIQGFQQHRLSFGKQMYCNGLIHCLRLTVSEEGFLALYKGFLPSLFKAVLVTALHFAAYDEIKHHFQKDKGNKKNSTGM